MTEGEVVYLIPVVTTDRIWWMKLQILLAELPLQPPATVI
jgi:hypothetical protein